MILVTTGHRPKKLAKDYDTFYREIEPKLLQFTKIVLTQKKPDRVLHGMAAGFDLVVGQACLDLGIPYWACVPHRTQVIGYTSKVRQQYMHIFESAEKKVLVTKGEFNMGVFDKRNEWMVDRSDAVLALWNGSNSGTGNCVEYARRCHKPLDDVWEEWEKFRDSDFADIL